MFLPLYALFAARSYGMVCVRSPSLRKIPRSSPS